MKSKADFEQAYQQSRWLAAQRHRRGHRFELIEECQTGRRWHSRRAWLAWRRRDHDRRLAAQLRRMTWQRQRQWGVV